MADISGIRKSASSAPARWGPASPPMSPMPASPFVLLDIVPKDAANRNAIAEGAVEKLLKTDPAAFMSKRAAKLMTPGNIEDDLSQLADCDWIVEAVSSASTSSRPLRQDRGRAQGRLGHLVQHLDHPAGGADRGHCPRRFAADFLHHPFLQSAALYAPAGDRRWEPRPRPTPSTASAASPMSRWAKASCDCKDSPGFIANRLGIYWMQVAVVEALDGGLDGRRSRRHRRQAHGHPQDRRLRPDGSGRHRSDAACHRQHGLGPADSDPFHAVNRELPLISKHDRRGLYGPQGQGRLLSPEPRQWRQGQGSHRPYDRRISSAAEVRAGDCRKRLRDLLSADTKAGRYALRVLAQTFAYAATLVPEAADAIRRCDEAMRLGYNWKFGPFELIDQLGSAWLAERLAKDNMPVPALLTLAGRSQLLSRRRRQEAVSRHRWRLSRSDPRPKASCCWRISS